VSLQQALEDGLPAAVLLDDADLAPETTQALVELIGRCLWITTGRTPVVGETVKVEPLAAKDLARLLPRGRDAAPYRGLPLLTVLPDIPSPEQPWAAVLEELFPGAELLAELPLGLPSTPIPIPGPLRLEIPGRTALRRSVREALGAEAQPSAATLAAALRNRIPELHRIACDLDDGSAEADGCLFRVAAARLADPELRALAAAAAARIVLRAFQPDAALNLARNALLQRLPEGARGLLHWLEGDALLARGSEDEAHQAHVSAAEALKDAGNREALAALARHCADQDASRGRTRRAREWLGTARSALGRDLEHVAVADAIRIAGDLAAHAGELVGAEGLYDEAWAILAERAEDAPARAAVCIGRAALAASRGEFDTAAEHLAQAEAGAQTPGFRAALLFRKAELALRCGDRSGSAAHEWGAREDFKRAGSLRGLALCARLRGDQAAVRGDRRAAAAAYGEAVQLCARTRDLTGTRRVLRRILAIEREGVPGQHIQDLEEALDLAEVLNRVE
jgi:predicted negative regulator of RcsB-dependent stress response